MRHCDQVLSVFTVLDQLDGNSILVLRRLLTEMIQCSFQLSVVLIRRLTKCVLFNISKSSKIKVTDSPSRPL